jgi:hypothetical protein
MRSIVNGEVSQHVIKLQQLGAKVNVINSTLCYVNFDISGFVLQYVYNVNSKGNYFLERTKPYPLALQEFDTEKDVVILIRKDVEKFKNALKSHHIDLFITIARHLNSTFVNFENTFLDYNLPAADVELILKKIQDIDGDLVRLKDTAKKIY